MYIPRYKDLIKKNLIDLGLSGWMADFGEYTPMYAQTGFDGRWWNEEYNEILHGYLPQDWASLNRLDTKNKPSCNFNFDLIFQN